MSKLVYTGVLFLSKLIHSHHIVPDFLKFTRKVDSSQILFFFVARFFFTELKLT